ncbi:hypothetical protein [Paraburkholderia humisilvae]|uniref:hypothetical protein n=1 Tax=Paraburkholderia humisilvae TaxID=627669 RepID=UPI001581FA49|nr:hypothetical protein [Paraburkholderia humisilvae]
MKFPIKEPLISPSGLHSFTGAIRIARECHFLTGYTTAGIQQLCKYCWMPAAYRKLLKRGLFGFVHLRQLSGIDPETAERLVS